METIPVRVTRRFDAGAGRVFDAWVDPAAARRFLFKTPAGEMVRCAIDGRPGGHYSIVERRGGEDVEHLGEYLEVARAARLAFTLQVPRYSPNTDRIVLDFVPAPGGGCDVILSHYMNAQDAAVWAERAKEGWTGILQALARIL